MQELLEARASVMHLDNQGRNCLDALLHNHKVRSRNVLCEAPLEHAMSPLWLAQARAVQTSALQKKTEWFRAELSRLHRHLEKAELESEDERTLVVKRFNALQSMCEQQDAITPRMNADSVTFEGENGMGAGVLRDLFVVLTQEFANENFNLFVTTATDAPRLALSIRPCFNDDRGSYFEMVGRIVGLALLHQQHLPVQFALPLIKQLLGIKLCMKDLTHLDPTLYARIVDLRSFTAEQLAQLQLDFTIDEHNFGKRRKVDLTMNGAEIPVTVGNVEVYISLYLEHHLRGNAHLVDSLKRGLHHFCPKSLLNAAAECFTEAEFDLLLSGSQDIDVDDWQKNTKYEGCSARFKVVKWFWTTVRNFTKHEHQLLLRFATGQCRMPLAGFGMLKSADEITPFTIVLKEAPQPSNPKSYFPSAATCSNALLLPHYSDAASLKKYLSSAIQETMMAFDENQAGPAA